MEFENTHGDSGFFREASLARSVPPVAYEKGRLFKRLGNHYDAAIRHLGRFCPLSPAQEAIPHGPFRQSGAISATNMDRPAVTAYFCR
jgi:hypothetical protein